VRRAAALACALLLALAVGAPVAGAAEELVVQKVDTDEYPAVGIDVILPAEMLAGDGEVAFTVEENGRAVDDLSWKEAPAGSRAVDVVLLVDTSGSMKGDALASAKAAASAFIDELQPGSRVAVVSFASKPVVATGFVDDKGRLKASVNGLAASGETALNDALAQAAALPGIDAENSPTVVLLSDGGDTVSRGTLDAALKALKARQIPVFVVALPSEEADPQALESIATQTGGRLLTVQNLDQLVGYYEGLARELQMHYLLDYKSGQPNTKDLDIFVTAGAGGQTSQGAALVANPLYAGGPPQGTGLTVVPAANLLAYSSAVGFVFLSVGLMAAALMLVWFRPRSQLDQLSYYDQLKGMSGELPDEDSADPDSFRARMMGAVDQVAGKRGFTRLVHDSLERAGLPLRPNEYIVGHFLAVVAVGVVVQLLTGRLGFAVIAIVLATALPIMYVRYRADKRRTMFEEQLPDVLTLVAGSLRSGWGMLQAIELVTREMAPPASEEFKRVETEVRLGMPLEQSLRAMAERIDSDDFRWAVSAIAIQREVGGNLAEVLDIIAKTIRERAALRRQVSALTSEGRLSAIILIALPVLEFGFLYIINPRYMSLLFTTIPGLIMLIGWILLMVVGGFWLRAVMTVEV
jgi:tight adherence protein B